MPVQKGVTSRQENISPWANCRFAAAACDRSQAASAEWYARLNSPSRVRSHISKLLYAKKKARRAGLAEAVVRCHESKWRTTADAAQSAAPTASSEQSRPVPCGISNLRILL